MKSLSGAKTLLAVCAFVALSPAAWADQSHHTYTVAAGGISAPIPVPGTNTPVSVTCSNNTSGYRGVGQATILRVLPDAFLEWVGTDIATSVISSGYTNSNGTHIIYCSYVDKYVEIQVNSASQIQVKNNGSTSMTGVIDFVW
ncbi:MAG TPA: hypothetical protein VGH80_06060 [Xanthomonadaceae bacterium]